MGRRSTKADKNIYQITREELGLTREKAGELMQFISPERIEKIENEKVRILPDDILAMAKCYKAPHLCNYYCSHECEIGRKYVTPIEKKELSQIAVETLNGLHKLDQEKDRLLEIVEDGRINDYERDDFLRIKSRLDKLALSISSLQLWLDEKIAEGELKEEDFSSAE
ncbi:MAG: helix-turn-helix transcriptional regulator [Lachnospiraceae bacterium]|nr:helix-turn-helix transcriptional regulator [Lachnospiraceae bacterium]